MTESLRKKQKDKLESGSERNLEDWSKMFNIHIITNRTGREGNHLCNEEKFQNLRIEKFPCYKGTLNAQNHECSENKSVKIHYEISEYTDKEKIL